MADKAPSKTPETKKRRLKPAQTVREQAAQAQTKADKPAKTRALKASSDKPRKRPLAPVGRFLNKVFNRQPFRFIGKILVPPFIRGSFSELKQVTWPNRRETARLTFAVIIFAIIFGAIVTAVDYGLDKVFKALILN